MYTWQHKFARIKFFEPKFAKYKYTALKIELHQDLNIRTVASSTHTDKYYSHKKLMKLNYLIKLYYYQRIFIFYDYNILHY